MKKYSVFVLLVIGATMLAFAGSVFHTTVLRDNDRETKNDTVEKCSTESSLQDTIVYQKDSVSRFFKRKRKGEKASYYIKEYSSNSKIGRIGNYGGQIIDNPSDNVFHIEIDDTVGITAAYLHYDLYGVKNLHSVSRSINNGFAMGGAVYEHDTVWRHQKERIPLNQLKAGNNVIRFTSLFDNKYGYAVQNVKIVAKVGGNDNSSPKLVLNTIKNAPSGRSVYVSGYITGNIADSAFTVKANGQELHICGGEVFGSIAINNKLTRKGCSIEIESEDGKEWDVLQEVHYKQNPKQNVNQFFTTEITRVQELAKKGDTLTLHVGGASLFIDSTSIAESAQIVMSTLRAIDIMPTQAGMVNVTGENSGFRMLPHGIQFESPVRIGLPYDTAYIPNGYTEKDIRTYYFDEGYGRWTVLPFDTIDTENQIAYAYSTHFTDFINGVIQVPESPETQGFTPTSIKELAVADPAAGIQLFSAPTVDNKGAANISYPLKIPKGRNGMTPNLTLQYSSQGGDGWLGHGWSLNIPSISVVTGWGVPRYDSIWETETYQLGEMLSPVAHRSEWNPREADKEFSQVIEGSFNRIIRKGDHPSNYWWEVTTTSGMKYYYGSSDGENLDPECVLASDEGNIAEWKLAKQVDVNGNEIVYEYQSVDYEKGGVNIKGVLYPRVITYTGYKNERGNCHVFFHNEFSRKDYTRISCNYGFPVSESVCLSRVELRNKSRVVGQYKFTHDITEFNTPVLVKLGKFDAIKNEYYSHFFEYHNDIAGDNFYKDVVSYTIPTNGLDGGGVIFDIVEASAIGASKSESAGAGIYVGVGLGCDVGSKSGTIGGNFSYDKSTTEGINTLIDLNGDGLPDKVFIIGKSLYFRPQLKGENTFGETTPLNIDLEFSETETKTITKGFGVVVKDMIGVTKSTSRSSTTNYFAEVNNDGLVDLVYNGTVYYNHINNDGIPSFTRNLSDLVIPTYEGGIIATDLIEVDYNEWNEEVQESPLNDIVRVWEAPFSGKVQISGEIDLVYRHEAVENENTDGVIAKVQIRDSLLWADSIVSPLFDPISPNNLNCLVAKGDRIYFRLQSNFNAMYDAVGWSPVVEYVDTIQSKDANGIDCFRFDAESDFLLSSPLGLTLPLDGTITIKSPIYKPLTSDDVIIDYVLTDPSGGDSLIYKDTIAWDESFSDTVTIENIQVKGDYHNLLMRVSSPSNIVWSSLESKAWIEYTSAIDSNGIRVEVDSINKQTYFTTTDYITYNKSKGSCLPVIGLPYNKKLNFSPIRNDYVQLAVDGVTQELIYGTFSLSVKKRDVAPATKEMVVEDKEVGIDSLLKGIEYHAGDDLFIELYTKDTSVFNALDTWVNVSWLDTIVTGKLYHNTDVPMDLPLKTITLSDTLGKYVIQDDGKIIFTESGHEMKVTNLQLEKKREKVAVGVYTISDDVKFGPMYRNWGQFSYHSDNYIINEDVLFIKTYDSIPYFTVDTTKNYNENEAVFNEKGGTDLMDKPFIKLYASFKNNRWVGYDDSVYVSKYSMSCSRRGEKDLIPYKMSQVKNVSDSRGNRAIIKKSKTKSTIYHTGLPYSRNKSHSEILTDFMDMNGDGYPDIVSGQRVQYSSPLGNISPLIGYLNGNISLSNSVVKGYALNSAVPRMKKNQVSKNAVGITENTNSSSGAGLNVSVNYHTDEDDFSFFDINADGLPDKVIKGKGVRLNCGYNFSEIIPWSEFHDIVRQTSNRDLSVGLSAQILPGLSASVQVDPETGDLKSASVQYEQNAGSVVLGAGFASNDSHTNIQFMDITGDGLVDRIRTTDDEDPVTYVSVNNGTGFSKEILYDDLSTIYKLYNINAQLNFAFTFGFCIPLPFAPPIKFVFNPQVNVSRGFNKTKESMVDFDGDGHLDYLTSNKEGKLNVKHSNYGKTLLLKEIKNALGSTISLDYEAKGNTFDMQRQVKVLSEVVVYDGHKGDGADTMRTTYEYGNGYYDRYERAFYGFDTVITKQHDTENENKVFRSTVENYENGNLYSKGLLLKRQLFDEDGKIYTATENSYSFRNVKTGEEVNRSGLPRFSKGESFFSALVKTKDLFYEGDSVHKMSYSKAFEYDEYGNVTKYYDFGDKEAGDVSIEGNVTYHSKDDKNIYSIPASIEVLSNGDLYRKRKTDIDNNGNITKVISYVSNESFASVDLGYDIYGNIIKKTLPKNEKGERMFYEYTYDDTLHTNIINIKDAFGYESSFSYHHIFGKVKTQTDINGNSLFFNYDNKGRLTYIKGPYEYDTETIEHTYIKDFTNGVDSVYAYTIHYDPAHANDSIETHIFTDGLGRVIQTKKDAEVDSKDKVIVSGHTKYDAFGRTVELYFPVVEDKGNEETINRDISDIAPTKVAFDILDREIKQTLPDNSEIVTKYGFGEDRNGRLRRMVEVIDPLDNATATFSDVRNRQVGVKMQGDIWLSTEYDPIGQVLNVTDHDGNVTSSVYDLLGRRTERNHPDAGKTIWTYDNASNITRLQPAHIPQPITYVYEFNRLTEVNYPINTCNNVKYEYGKPDDDFNRAGRIVSQSDASGTQHFKYGKMGEVTEIKRTIIVPDKGKYAFTTSWEYDSWNRLHKMVYPDGEEVTYSYNSGGTLQSMSGAKGMSEYHYVKDIKYDKFGQRTFIEFGNGVKTSYTYDEKRRWLQNLQTVTSTNREIQNNAYSFDAVGNITQLTNAATELDTVAEQGIYGGTITHNYTYDNRYQLISADGTYTTPNKIYKYDLTMEYGNTGQILRKKQENSWRLNTADADSLVEWKVDKNTTVDFTYEYGGSTPHSISSLSNGITGETFGFEYDPAGNIVANDEKGLQSLRQIQWTEESRISAIKSFGNVSHYIYDANGERSLKMHSNSLGISINGMSADIAEVENDFTMYPSAFFVVRPTQATKHYYIEGSRILSKICNDDVEKVYFQGGDNANSNGADGSDDRQGALENAIQNDLADFGLPFYRDENGQVPNEQLELYLNSHEQQNASLSDSVEYESPDIYNPDYEVHQYYVHPDHLGSATFITHVGGETYQHVEYLPFGEVFIEERKTEQDRFTFLYNGKELDPMTNLYYYGARYYDPELGIFLSVDPLAEDELNISFNPYHYTANNPVRFIDPTGMIWEDAEGNELTGEQHKGVKTYIFYDPKDFKKQAMKQYKRATEEDGEGTVALSAAKTEKEFSKDWEDMAGESIKTVNVDYHGSNQALHLDSEKKEYIVSTGIGKTNVSGTSGTDVTDLPIPKGNISNARLNLNSCKSASKSQHTITNGTTLYQSFLNNTRFKSVRGTEGGVSYYDWFHFWRPYLKAYPNNGGWLIESNKKK